MRLHPDLSADLDWGGVNQQEERSSWGERQSLSNRNKGTLSTSTHKEPEANMVKLFYFCQQCYLAALFWGQSSEQGVRGLVKKRENWCEALGWPCTFDWTRFTAGFPDELLRNQDCDHILITSIFPITLLSSTFLCEFLGSYSVLKEEWVLKNESKVTKILPTPKMNSWIHTWGYDDAHVLLCTYDRKTQSIHPSIGATIFAAAASTSCPPDAVRKQGAFSFSIC